MGGERIVGWLGGMMEGVSRGLDGRNAPRLSISADSEALKLTLYCTTTKVCDMNSFTRQ
jgi:hypothetical protein